MIQTVIKNVKNGEFIRFKDSESSPMWIRENYERSCRKYSLISYEDSCKELFRNGSCLCYVENEDSLINK